MNPPYEPMIDLWVILAVITICFIGVRWYAWRKK